MGGQSIRSRMSLPAKGTGGSGPPFAGTLDTVVYHTITAPELAAKQFNLAVAPATLAKVECDVHQGPPALVITVDFNIAGVVFSWGGLGLDGLVQVNTVIRLAYNSA